MSSNFDILQDPFLKQEVTKLYNWSKTFFWANITIAFIPGTILFFFRQYALINWIHCVLTGMALLLSLLLYVISRPHTSINTFLNVVHLLLAMAAVLDFVIYIPLWQMYGDVWPDIFDLIFMLIVPGCLSLLHLVSFSWQCSEVWAYATNIALGTVKWSYDFYLRKW